MRTTLLKKPREEKLKIADNCSGKLQRKNNSTNGSVLRRPPDENKLDLYLDIWLIIRSALH